MAKILLDNVWFSSVRSNSWLEEDYEDLIRQYAKVIWPQWICSPFKADVQGEDGAIKRPDLALVDPGYRTWWVVEVELASHNLISHVLPQVEAFRTGFYTREHANYLHRETPTLDVDRLGQMMLGSAPEILVIVDRPETGWLPNLRAMGVHLSIIEPFRDAANHLLLRVNGHQPEPPAASLSRCSRFAARLWKVHSPGALPPAIDGGYQIEWEGSVSHWRRLELADGVMICPDRGDTLTGWRSVELVRRDDGLLAFIPVSKQ
jgi:hypothetical protein